MEDTLKVSIKGHCLIQDDLGQVLLDKDNDIHPQNMARILARGLSNEPNGCIYRIAFGNGGSEVDILYNVTLKPANVGTVGTDSWDTRIYNETYSEIVDSGMYTLNTELGVDPGSADSFTGIRPGGGSVPSSDPASVLHVSGPGVRSTETGTISELLIRAVINANEPNGDVNKDGPVYNIDSAYAFDEIGLYSKGAPAIATSGYQYVNVGNKVSTDLSGLAPSTLYTLILAIDGGTAQTINYTTPALGTGPSNEILYGDLCETLNSVLPAGVTVSITDTTDNWTSIQDARTFGKLKFSSVTTGDTSSITITEIGSTLLAPLTSFVSVETAVLGTNIGYRNSPTLPDQERERLLTHLTFTPIIKDPGRTLTVSYTITVSVTVPAQ